MATSGADGSCDVSPKGDPSGFALVLDERTIALPERAGNRRADGYRNVLANPHVGLLFVIPGRGDTLRVNGSAWTSGSRTSSATTASRTPRGCTRRADEIGGLGAISG